MYLDSLWNFLEQTVFALPGSAVENRPAFNFYRQAGPGSDRPNAAFVRQTNLHNYLDSFPGPPKVILLGEAPGWRGCRFSGVPFTSEDLLVNGSLPFTGQPSSASPACHKEASATVVWQTMQPYFPHFFTWNCIPLHLHQPGKPLSNRSPSRHEIAQYLEVTREVIQLLAPERIIAVGRSAAAALHWMDIAHAAVRHPSHGGATLFRNGIRQLMG